MKGNQVNEIMKDIPENQEFSSSENEDVVKIDETEVRIQRRKGVKEKDGK
jgi:hypothetical protein